MSGGNNKSRSVLKQGPTTKQCLQSCNQRANAARNIMTYNPSPANAFTIRKINAAEKQCVKSCTTNNIRSGRK